MNPFCKFRRLKSYILIKIIKYSLVIVTLTGVLGFFSTTASVDKIAQLALIIDFSKSSETTVQALISNYWEFYNEFNLKNPEVKLELAILGYSKMSFGKKNKYVKILSDFKDPPEKAFQYLVDNEVGSSVADNNVGFALDLALKKLTWRKEEEVKKEIFLIGNGPITDSFSSAKKSCEKAKKENIVINSLYVLYKQTDKNHSYWMKLTEMAGGELKTVVPQYLVASNVASNVRDNNIKIASENEIINSTYMPYGENGKVKMNNIHYLDMMSEENGIRVLSSRVQFKTGPYFQSKNRNWDIVECCVLFDIFGDELRALGGIPVEMEGLNDIELETALSVKWIERNGSIQIVNMLTKSNEQISAGLPKPPAYKKDLSETILKIFNKGGF